MIAFACAGCGKQFRVQDEFAGRTTTCSACKRALVVPKPAPVAQPALAPTATPASPGASNWEKLRQTPGSIKAPADVFVSYARSDDASVYAISVHLMAQGMRLWIDRIELLPGDCFRTEIARAIDQCKCVMLMCSQHSLASDFCFKEIVYASNQKRTMVSVWLCQPCPMPGKFALELGPYQQINTSDRPVEVWLAELIRFLRARGDGRRPSSPDSDRERLREQRLAIQTVCQRRDWQAALEAGHKYLELVPNDTEIVKAVGIAWHWLNHEQNQYFSTIRQSRRASDWAEYLARYPHGAACDHARRKIAHLLPIGELEEYHRLCIANAAADPQATGWRIAAAVCRFRLGRYSDGLAALEEVRAVAPAHAEMMFFRVVAALHSIPVGSLTAERAGAIHQQLRIVMDLAPDCGLPDLLAGLVARDYCEVHGLPCQLGDSHSLFGRATAKGTTPDDLTDLQALVGGPTVSATPPRQNDQAVPSQMPRSQPFVAAALPVGPAGLGAKAWIIAAAVTLVVGAGIGIALAIGLSGSGDKSAATTRVNLTVGDFVELRFSTKDVPVTSNMRYEVIGVDGDAYQLRQSYSIGGKMISESTLQYNLAAISGGDADIAVLETEFLGKIGVGGVNATVARQGKRNWSFEGKTYQCDVVTFKLDTSEAEYWIVNDPYFRAVLPLWYVYADLRFALTPTVVVEVSGARFAARP